MSPGRAIALDFALLPGDRQNASGVDSLSVVDNMLLPDVSRFFRGGFLRRGAMVREARALGTRYEVRPNDPSAKLSSLSGGNAQKVLIARWMNRNPKLLLLDEPTQGVDVGTRVQIYAALRAAAVVRHVDRVREFGCRAAGRDLRSRAGVRARPDLPGDYRRGTDQRRHRRSLLRFDQSFRRRRALSPHRASELIHDGSHRESFGRTAEPASASAAGSSASLCWWCGLALIAVYGAAMPQSFLTWGNFSILFASYAPAAMLALAIIVPLTAGDYDLSVGATLTLSSAVIGVLNVWMHLPILLVLAIVIVDRRDRRPGQRAVHFVLPDPLARGHARHDLGDDRAGAMDHQLVDHWRHRQRAGHGGRRRPAIRRALRFLLRARALRSSCGTCSTTRRSAAACLFVGRGREVARLNGISVDRVRLGALVTSGVLSALAGILYAGVLGSADPYSGLNFLLPAFAAALSRRHNDISAGASTLGA